jgi:hypothetical protein
VGLTKYTAGASWTDSLSVCNYYLRERERERERKRGKERERERERESEIERKRVRECVLKREK